MEVMDPSEVLVGGGCFSKVTYRPNVRDYFNDIWLPISS